MADSVARWQRIKSDLSHHNDKNHEGVFFVTGTDEHGLKVCF